MPTGMVNIKLTTVINYWYWTNHCSVWMWKIDSLNMMENFTYFFTYVYITLCTEIPCQSYRLCCRKLQLAKLWLARLWLCVRCGHEVSQTQCCGDLQGRKLFSNVIMALSSALVDHFVRKDHIVSMCTQIKNCRYLTEIYGWQGNAILVHCVLTFCFNLSV